MKTSLTEEQGIQAIMALQKLVGASETEEQAKAGWNSMSEWDKWNTQCAHETLCGRFDAQGKNNID